MSPRLVLTPVFILTFATALFWASATNAADVPPVTGAQPVTSVTAAAALWPNLADDFTPVLLEGVVTSTNPSGAFRIHDGELGIYVTRGVERHPVKPGDRVRVHGVLRKGGFSPWISPRNVQVLGPGEFPDAQSASYHLLASGVADNQWLEVEGVVRSADIPEPPDFVVLDLAMNGGNLRVFVNHDGTSRFDHFVDAAVRLRGIAAVNVNKHGHVVEPTFRVPSFAEVRVLQPAPLDVFAGPVIPIQGLMKSSHQQNRYPRRVLTRGVVTRQLSATRVFVRDGGSGLNIETVSPTQFRPGDVIEAAGYPVMIDGLEALQFSICRKAGNESRPEPVDTTVPELLKGIHNADLVRLQARLVDWVVAGQNVTLVFQAGDYLVKGVLVREGTSGDFELPEKNSLVDVTGICVVGDLEEGWSYKPRSFLLLLAHLADLKMVQAPSWWTANRLWWALAITGMVLIAVVGWVWALRRQIERKRGVIEQQARHAAALEERSRIARELHDTLEQGLTGLSLQMKAIETDLDQTPDRVRSRLHSARQMLRQSRALARNAIRELRTELVQGRHEGLLHGLKRVANSWNHSGALKVNVHVNGKVRAMPLQVEHQLLGIGTEAMTNAVKHGRADTVSVELSFQRHDVALRVKDNGVGFDLTQQLEKSSGCFGLIGMRERAREMGAGIQFNSSPRQGTEVVVVVPIADKSKAPEPEPAPEFAEPAPIAPLDS